MIFRISIRSWRFTFTLAPISKVIGVNSNLPDGNHIVMWDFDDIPLILVEVSLRWVQEAYSLPPIYILNTGAKDHYIAYCFHRCTWKESIEIVACTEYVDPSFFRFGVYRKHWTLRVSPKEGRKPKLIKILDSPWIESVSLADLRSWVKYETIADKAPIGKRELNIGRDT